jgi:hypothetical protein
MMGLQNTMLGSADEMEARMTPMFIELMLSMTDEQVARLPKKLAASNDELAKPEVDQSLDSAQARWRDDVADMFSRFAGRLSPEQQKYLTSQSVRYLPERILWADYRRRWQADLLSLLSEREDAVRFAERYLQIAANRESYFGAELAHIFDNNEALGREVGGWLLNNMTDGQQERLFERLLDYAVEFRELAAQADSLAPPADGCLLTC